MALNANQIADILFKKVAAGKATTEFGRFYGNGEEPSSGRSFVDLSQIWAQSNLIPSTATNVANIVEQITVQLTNIAGSSSFSHASLKNVIPFNYGDGSSYAYTLTQNNGSTVIPPGVNDWYLDTETGVLTFFSGDTDTPGAPGALPTGVTTGSGPYITCYKYIGKTAADTGLSGGNGGTISMGEWQNSVDSLITELPLTPSNGDRYIYNSASGTSADLIDITTEVITVGTIDPYSIIEYVTINSTSGWVATPATMGMFTSVDTSTPVANAVYFYNTTSHWTKYEGEKTYPTELSLVAQDTFAQSTGNYAHILSDTQIVQNGTPSTDVNVYVNGIKLKDTHFDIVALPTALTLTFVEATTTTTVDFIDASTITVGDLIKLTADSETVWRVVSDVTTNTVTFTGTAVADITDASVYELSGLDIHSIPVEDDYIMIKSTLPYDIEAGNGGDDISIEYVRPNA